MDALHGIATRTESKGLAPDPPTQTAATGCALLAFTAWVVPLTAAIFAIVAPYARTNALYLVIVLGVLLSVLFLPLATIAAMRTSAKLTVGLCLPAVAGAWIVAGWSTGLIPSGSASRTAPPPGFAGFLLATFALLAAHVLLPIGIVLFNRDPRSSLRDLGHDLGAAGPPQHCSNCGYDLTGLPPRTICPECGAVERLATDSDLDPDPLGSDPRHAPSTPTEHGNSAP